MSDKRDDDREVCDGKHDGPCPAWHDGKRPSNVVPLRPRPPATAVQLNGPELKLLIASLDNAEHVLKRNFEGAEGKRAAHSVELLRMRLQIALHAVELAERKRPPP